MKITKDELSKLYNENPTSEVVKQLGISIATLYNYLRILKIKKKGRRKNSLGKTKIKLEM